MYDPNKRKFPRANYPCCLTIWQKDGYNTILANTANVGAGGLLVYLNQSLMIGAKVEIKIDFTPNVSFECSGLVLRCQETLPDASDPRRFYAVAVIYEGLDEAKVAYLKGLVQKLLAQGV